MRNINLIYKERITFDKLIKKAKKKAKCAEIIRCQNFINIIVKKIKNKIIIVVFLITIVFFFYVEEKIYSYVSLFLASLL